MNNAYNQCSLYLQPCHAGDIKQNISSLLIELKNIALIADKINDKDTQYYCGEKFLDYIAYMGCAPNIQFEASEDNKNFCFIKIHQHETKQLIVSKTQAKPPYCPKCSKPVKDWRSSITDTTIICNHCRLASNIENFNWKKTGGYGQLFIEITDIFPKEAIPQQSLLDQLSSITNTDWQYFYSCR